MNAAAEVDWGAVAELLEAARIGGVRDRESFVEALVPIWQRQLSRSPLFRGRHTREDDVRAVLVKLIEKFTPGQGRALNTYEPWAKSHPDKELGDWVRIVTANAARDYLRSQKSQMAGESPVLSVKRILNEFHSAGLNAEPGARPPFTAKETARQMLEFAEARLEEAQLRSLRLWLCGATFGEIGVELECSEQRARNTLRAAIGRLRRQFLDR